MKNELLGKDERVWWADLLSQEEMDSEFDIAVGLLMSEHPKQGPLEWQGRLFEVVPKSELQRVQGLLDECEKMLWTYQNMGGVERRSRLTKLLQKLKGGE